MEVAVPADDVHPFFNGKNFVLFLVCGVVLFLAGGALTFDGLKTPPADQLQRHEFPCPVDVQEDTVRVRSAEIKSYTFTIPGGPKVEFPLRTPDRETVLQALTSSAPGTICVALVGQALELTLYGLSLRDEVGERSVLRHEDTFAANRDVTFQVGLCLGGLALASLILALRRRFLSPRAAA